jgi:ubiquinone/menaquinone biosynthesis C-methylase UbiE
MNIYKYFKQRLQGVISHSLNKESSEFDFWSCEIQYYVKWYKGKIRYLYGIPHPTQREKIVQFSLEENAIRTWAEADIERYLNRLLVRRDYFAGKRLLDVGCGPIPYALAFNDCKIWGIYPLVDSYKRIGFPLDRYSDRLTYLNASVEKIPCEDNFFDAVISVNSIDHVDDFPLAAQEISRVLRPGGILRMEVHYHSPTTCEPWKLDDSIIIQYFDHLEIQKVSEKPFTELNQRFSNLSNPLAKLYTFLQVWQKKNEKLVVWANDFDKNPIIYQGNIEKRRRI